MTLFCAGCGMHWLMGTPSQCECYDPDSDYYMEWHTTTASWDTAPRRPVETVYLPGDAPPPG